MLLSPFHRWRGSAHRLDRLPKDDCWQEVWDEIWIKQSVQILSFWTTLFLPPSQSPKIRQAMRVTDLSGFFTIQWYPQYLARSWFSVNVYSVHHVSMFLNCFMRLNSPSPDLRAKWLDELCGGSGEGQGEEYLLEFIKILLCCNPCAWQIYIHCIFIMI